MGRKRETKLEALLRRIDEAVVRAKWQEKKHGRSGRKVKTSEAPSTEQERFERAKQAYKRKLFGLEAGAPSHAKPRRVPKGVCTLCGLEPAIEGEKVCLACTLGEDEEAHFHPISILAGGPPETWEPRDQHRSVRQTSDVAAFDAWADRQLEAGKIPKR